MIRTFAALNSKGGVGKTTLLANLGGLLADMGARTLLVDADPQPSLSKYDGTAQSITLVARLMRDPGDRVLIEDPCYWAAWRTLEDWGLVLEPVPVGDEGAPAPSAPPPHQAPARLAYLTPSHQYPTGAAMPPEVRLAWLAHARSFGTLLLEADYDSEFPYNGAPFPSLQGLGAETAAGNRVIYLGSFSKAMFPWIRLAFMIVPPTLAEVFAAAETAFGRDGDQLLHQTMARFIAEGHFGARVRTLRREFSARRQLLVQSPLSEVPGLVSRISPLRILGGPRGVHLALGLPRELDDQAMAQAAGERGVTVIPLLAYGMTGSHAGLLLSFSGVPREETQPHVQRLAPILNRIQPKSGSYYEAIPDLRALTRTCAVLAHSPDG